METKELIITIENKKWLKAQTDIMMQDNNPNKDYDDISARYQVKAPKGVEIIDCYPDDDKKQLKVLNTSYDIKIEVDNIRFPNGSLATKSLKTDAELLDILLNELLRRYWIVKVRLLEDEDSTLIYIAPKPIVGADIPKTIEEFDEMTKTDLTFYNKEEKARIIFDYTLQHQWKLLTKSAVVECINEIADERSFYLYSYWNIIKDHAADQVNNLLSDDIEQKAKEYFDRPGNLAETIDLLTKNAKNSTKHDAKMLSLFKWVKYLTNIRKFAIKEKDYEKLIDGLKSTNEAFIFNWADLAVTWQQYDLKTLDHRKILDLLELNHQIVTNDFARAAKKHHMKHFLVQDVVHNFYKAFKDNWERGSQNLMKALYTINYMQTDEPDNVFTLDNFVNSFLKAGENLDTQELREKFYADYMQNLEVHNLHQLALLKAEDATDDLAHEQAMQIRDWLEVEANEEANQECETAFKNSGLAESKKERYKSTLFQELYGEKIERLNSLQASLGFSDQTVFSDLETLINSLDALHYYTNFNENGGIYYATYDDLIANKKKLTNFQQFIALSLNFCPNKQAQMNSDIKIFDPMLDITTLNQTKKLRFGLDFEKLNRKMLHLLQTEYRNSEGNGTAIKRIKPYHRIILDLMQTYFQTKVILGDKTFSYEYPEKDNTIDTFYCMVANASFLHKLGTFYVALLGKGNNGKSSFSLDLQRAFGMGNCYLKKKAIADHPDKFTEYGKVGRLVSLTDDNGGKSLTESNDERKNETTPDGWLAYEIKGVNGMHYAPRLYSVFIFTNEITKEMLNDPSSERRAMIFKSIDNQEAIEAGLYQEELFLHGADRSMWVMSFALNTYTRVLATKQCEPEDTVRETTAMSYIKQHLGGDSAENYLLSYLMTYYDYMQDKPEGIRTIQHYGEPYTIVPLYFDKLYAYYMSWHVKYAMNLKSKYTRDGFISHYEDLFAKSLWTKTWKTVFGKWIFSKRNANGKRNFAAPANRCLLIPESSFQDLMDYAESRYYGRDQDILTQFSNDWDGTAKADLELNQKVLNEMGFNETEKQDDGSMPWGRIKAIEEYSKISADYSSLFKKHPTKIAKAEQQVLETLNIEASAVNTALNKPQKMMRTESDIGRTYTVTENDVQPSWMNEPDITEQENLANMAKVAEIAKTLDQDSESSQAALEQVDRVEDPPTDDTEPPKQLQNTKKPRKIFKKEEHVIKIDLQPKYKIHKQEPKPEPAKTEEDIFDQSNDQDQIEQEIDHAIDEAIAKNGKNTS